MMNDDLCYSYLMGANEKILKLIEMDFKIDEVDGDYEVIFPKEKTGLYEDFILKNLQPGFWNEYINNETMVFMFRHKDGKFQKITLNHDNENMILNLCCGFANTKFTSIKDMVLGNDFYKNNIKFKY